MSKECRIYDDRTNETPFVGSHITWRSVARPWCV